MSDKPEAAMEQLTHDLEMAKLAIEDLELQLAAAHADLESGFMKGAYARLKELQEAERKLAALSRATEPATGCPCTMTTPCSPRCSCAHPYQSGGCARCCTYGSLEQRKAAAIRLAGRATEPNAAPQPAALSDERAVPEHWRAKAQQIISGADANNLYERGRQAVMLLETLLLRESAAQPEGWVPPQEATPEMIESVASILQPYAAKLVWKRMLEMSLIAPKGKP